MVHHSDSNRHPRLLVASAVLLLCAVPASAQVSVETFVIATSGQTAEGVFGQPPPLISAFGSTPVAVPGSAVSDAGKLAATGVGGTYRTQSAVGNVTVADALSVSGTGNSQFGAWTYSGNSSASAVPGQLKAASSATHNGGSDSQSMNNAASYALFRETLQAVSAAIQPGTPVTMRIAWTIDGSMTVSGIGGVGMRFKYGYGATAPGTPALDRTLVESAININGGGYSAGQNSYLGSGTLPPGMGYTVGAVNPQGRPAFVTLSGLSTVYMDVPMTMGSATPFRVGLLTFTSANNGDATMFSDFGQTATLTGIQLFDNSNRPITDFSLASGSGASYDANGVHLVAASAPEPASFALVGIALGIAGGCRRFRKAA